MRRHAWITLVVLAALASGCARTLIFATGTTLGLKVSAAQEAQPRAELGFERSEGVLMPISESRPEGYPLYADICMINRWPLVQGDGGRYLPAFLNPNRGEVDTMPSGLTIRQQFAVEDAAKSLAEKRSVSDCEEVRKDSKPETR